MKSIRTRPHPVHSTPLIGALALTLAGCVSQQSVRINAQTASEIPRTQAIAFVRDYVLPPNAEAHVKMPKAFRDYKQQYACEYGADTVTFKDGGRRLAYSQLRFDAMDIQGASIMGSEDGVFVRIMPLDTESTICYVTLVPAGYPAADAERELRKLGTAFNALGIRQR